jgi:APA family basic amino acid/polyamine antiporter
MESPRPTLARNLGLLTTTAIVVGSVIGSGIFKKPAVMAAQLGSGELLLAVWVVAGILTLFGALTNAEIASMFPVTGGQYEFFRRMFGDFTAYLYGWAVFAVIQTGSIASIAYIFSEYAQVFVPLPKFPPGIEQAVVLNVPLLGTITPLANIGVKVLTILLVCGLTTVNYLGVRFGGAVQVTFTTLKVAAILVLVAAGFLLTGKAVEPAPVVAVASHSGVPMILAFAAAMSGAFWAYDGWNNITYVAGEVKDPQRTVPRALFIGTGIIIAVYVLVNLAYLHVLPIEAMAGSQLVAADMANAVMGGVGSGFVAAAVMISTFGTANGTILASARVYFAMSNRGRFFRPIGNIHPAFRTPGNALILQAAWTSLLVLSGTFDTLTDMLIFVSWVFYALGAAGIFVLRRTMPDAPRPYRVFGYPLVPAVFVVVATVYVGLTLWNDIAAFQRGEVPMVNSVFGLLLVATGIPFYLAFRSRPAADPGLSD